MPAQELVGCNDQRSEARAASPWLIRGRCGASGGTGASSSRLLTFDFDVNTGSASRPQACAAHRPLQPGVVLLALNETKSFAGYLSPLSQHSPLRRRPGSVSGNVGNAGNVSGWDQHWDSCFVPSPPWQCRLPQSFPDSLSCRKPFKPCQLRLTPPARSSGSSLSTIRQPNW